MPSIVVRIEWDTPDDPNWLNKYNVEIALSAYCSNTAFSVTDADDLLAQELIDLPEDKGEEF